MNDNEKGIDKIENKCTLLVNTCDAYSDVWELFFRALKEQWTDCKIPIVINTETKSYPNVEGITVVNYSSKNGKDCWGKRYKHALKKIATPYIIPVLEDFVLKERFTGNDLIYKTIEWMDKNSDIGVFYLHRHPFVDQKKTEYEGFGLMPQKSEYKLSTAFGIWRKDYLDKCIRGFETPWEWELYVSHKAWRYREKEYALLANQKEVFIFPYGGVIWRGLWHPDTVDLAKKYGVDIDFTKRGRMDENDPYNMKAVYSVRYNFPQKVLTAKYWQEFIKKVISIIRRFLCEI